MSEQLREIGGYFGLEEFSGTQYHADLVALNTGRNALVYLMRARQIRKLYIPVFLCDCVERVCIREGIAYEKYHIGQDFLPQFAGPLENGAWLYVVNYYGQVPDRELLSLHKRWGRVIVDYVQDFFRKSLPGIDTIYSCRKFFGVADGAYLATDAKWELPEDASRHRMTHVLGRYETSGSAYFSVFQENDELLYDLQPARMSPITRNLLQAVDYEAVCRRRTENFALLHKLLGERNGLHCEATAGPYCYPFRCADGPRIRKLLVQQKIYVPMLWPNVLEDMAAETEERAMARDILPLPCDQRYDVADMRRLAEAVLACLPKNG